MSKELIPRNCAKDLQNYINEAVDRLELNDIKTTTDEAKGIATISGARDGLNYSLVIEKSKHGQTLTASMYEQLPRKSDYKDEVKRLFQQGLKQKQIALRLGMSQSLVSRLLHE